jgi:hypothetical protein
MMLQLEPNSDQLNHLSGYYAAQLINEEWMQPISETHEIFQVTVKQAKPTSSSPVTIYAVRRPDKQWALFAINKDPKRAARLNVQFNFPESRRQVGFTGNVDVIQFSRDQYSWHDDGSNGHPTRSLPAARFTRKTPAVYDLPPYSLTVLRGKLPDW